MILHVRSRHLIVFDVLAVFVAYALSFVMRFDTEYILGQLRLYWKFVFPVLLVTIPALHRFGMYRRVWRYASTPEVAAVVGAVSLGSVAPEVVFHAAVHQDVVLLGLLEPIAVSDAVA